MENIEKILIVFIFLNYRYLRTRFFCQLFVDRQRVSMSFLNITDSKKRDAIVKEYLDTIKRIKVRNVEERAQDFAYNEALEKSLEPVVRSTTASTEALTKELLPIKEGITALNSKLHTGTTEPKVEPQSETESESDEEKLNIYQEIVMKSPKDKLDKYFGIEVTKDNQFLMGDKIVQIVGNYIFVDDDHYKGSRGLWSLILFKKPHKDTYNEQDMVLYKKLVLQTNVMKYPHNLHPSSKIKQTYKWRHIFSQFQEGHGIQFLPSDINSLQTKLSYLLGEYRSGNTSATRNEIVAIADNLLRRKEISKAEYKRINHYILQV